METKEPTVFLVDDDAGVRSMLVASLELHGYQVQDFESAKAFLDAYSSEQSGCLVLDLSMPTMNGLELQQELIKQSLTIPIIFITGTASIPQTVQALQAGAVDFLEKPFRHEILRQRIDKAFKTDQSLREKLSQHNSIHAKLARLTEREVDVLKLLVSGTASLSNKEIARELDISHRTVDHHRARIMEKTDAHSITELARMVDIAGLNSTTSE